MAINYLGRAPQFPFALDSNGRIVLISDEELIKQSLSEYLSEPIGSRFMLAEYGSKIKTLLFEKNTAILHSLLKTFILEALRQEQRIKVKDIQIIAIQEQISCLITYTIIKSNTIDTLIYEVATS